MTPSDAIPDSAGRAQSMAAARKVARPFYWSVRREVWEHRAIYMAPLIVAALAVCAFMIGFVRWHDEIRAMSAFELAKRRDLTIVPFGFAAAAILLTGVIVGVFYCLDALNAERRDRSILFWKSMPVSDLTTVLSKAAIPVAVLPAVVLVVALLAQAIMLVLSIAVLLANGVSPARFWSASQWLQMPVILIYGLAVHALWYLPVYAWLLVVSAWAKRAPFLWAVLPFFAGFVLERIAFGTSRLFALFKYRLFGGMTEAFAASTHGPITQLSQLEPIRFLSAPGLWLGLAVAAVLLAVAVRLRRYRDPM